MNAANPTLLGGGGVDGATHAAAGSELFAACQALPEVEPGVRCPTGGARVTPGFGLKARWVASRGACRGHGVRRVREGRPLFERIVLVAFRELDRVCLSGSVAEAWREGGR